MTLGMTVRALRLGFAPLPGRSGFMRLSGEGPFLCELRPIELVPNSTKTEIPHWCWWAHRGEPGIDITLIEGIRCLRRVKRPFSFYFDDDGKTITL